VVSLPLEVNRLLRPITLARSILPKLQPNKRVTATAGAHTKSREITSHLAATRRDVIYHSRGSLRGACLHSINHSSVGFGPGFRAAVPGAPTAAPISSHDELICTKTTAAAASRRIGP
jgi:hypothetical protein